MFFHSENMIILKLKLRLLCKDSCLWSGSWSGDYSTAGSSAESHSGADGKGAGNQKSFENLQNTF